MKNRIFALLSVCLLLTACKISRPETDINLGVSTRSPKIQSITISQNQILPPYGTTIVAETATLRLRVSTSQKDVTERLADIQRAIEHITAQVADNEQITLDSISVHTVGGGYSYERAPSKEDLRYLDTSAITFELHTSLVDTTLMKAVTVFNDWLQTLDLPEAVSVVAESIQADLGDLEAQRSQIIQRVYAELASVQAEYGEAVRYEVNGLYSSLQVIRLSDTHYYVYLDPIITVSEF